MAIYVCLSDIYFAVVVVVFSGNSREKWVWALEWNFMPFLRGNSTKKLFFCNAFRSVIVGRRELIHTSKDSAFLEVSSLNSQSDLRLLVCALGAVKVTPIFFPKISKNGLHLSESCTLSFKDRELGLCPNESRKMWLSTAIFRSFLWFLVFQGDFSKVTPNF